MRPRSAAGLYNHIDSKENLLLQIMGGIIDDLLDRVRKAVADVHGGDSVDPLQAALAEHITFHAERAQEVFLGNAELRSLAPGCSGCGHKKAAE